MRSVDIAALHDDLNTYLAYAQAGETVVIEEHNEPVAKLTPYSASSRVPFQPTVEDLELEAAGLIRLPEFEFDVDELWKMPEAQVRGNAGTQAILDEREQGW